MKRLIPFLLCATVLSVSAQNDELNFPRLVVGITVDQMRADMIARYWSGFGEDGFRRLALKGSWVQDARFDYVPTFTGPGHSSIYTGTGPSRHGIVANDWYDAVEGRVVNCVEDGTVKSLGGDPSAPGRSPRRMLASTIADELERFTNGRSKTIGISLKDRGAILPIGRTGDIAYWFDPVTGNFITSSYYTKGVPTWVREFNSEERARLYLSKPWEPLLPREAYENNLADNNPYELPIGGAATPTLPVDLPGLYQANKDLGLIKYTPLGNKLLTDMAIATVLHEELGIDEVTDLLSISYSSTDELGHETGPRSKEMEDMYYRLDREIARLLFELDELVGEDRYLLFLTSDHGAVDVPAYLQSLKASAGYVMRDSITMPIEAELAARFGEGPWIKGHRNHQIHLDEERIRKSGGVISEFRAVSVEALNRNPQVAIAVSSDQLREQEYTKGMRALMQQGFMTGRSGDVMYALHPGYLLSTPEKAKKGTTHGTGYSYDTQVPLLFFGYGMKEKQVLRSVTIKDIAPTIAKWCGFSLPDACEGQPIYELFEMK